MILLSSYFDKEFKWDVCFMFECLAQSVQMKFLLVTLLCKPHSIQLLHFYILGI